jgi:ABC-type antimicrobial peptide transport system permease subunit
MNRGRPQPPRWANRLLRWYCASDLLEEVEGDLEEEFLYRLKLEGERSARIDYVRSVLAFMTPRFIKSKTKRNPVLPMNMISHYFIVSLRQIRKHKAFAAINAIGLTLGITTSMIIYLWVQNEKLIDNFHVNGDRLYNVYITTQSASGTNGMYTAPIYYDQTQKRSRVHLESVRDVIPEIERIAYYHPGYAMPWGKAETFKVGDKVHRFEGSRANADFLKIFSFDVIAGDRETALANEAGIAISRKVANVFFNSPEEAIGKAMRYENYLDFEVTAVYEDLPLHTSLKFDFLANWHQATRAMPWSSNYCNATLLLKPGANPDHVAEQINKIVVPQLDKVPGTTTVLGLQPYRDQYLMSDFENGKPASGQKLYIRIFTGVAIFILVIACVNFMNLSTARAVKRAKEVGVRKVIGSTRMHLMGQFFGEALMLSVIALTFSLALLQVTIPFFNEFTGKQVALPFANVKVLLITTAIALTTGLLAGCYPALFLSSLKPSRVLKGVVAFSRGSLWMRKGLSVFQFGLSTILLIATIVMSKQTSFLQNTSPGYNKENLLYFPIEGKLQTYSGYSTFKQSALAIPGVQMIDRSSEAPHTMGFLVDENDGVKESNKADDAAIKWEGKQAGQWVGFRPTSVGFDFIKLMDLKLADGRGFTQDYATDSINAFMVNEQAVKEMDMKDPIGKWISAWEKKGQIIGILKDYNTNSLHERIRPLIVDVKEGLYFGVVMVRTEAGKTREALAGLEAVYKKLNPNFPFSFRFIDDETTRMYGREQMITTLSNTFAGLAIATSCLGLLGLIIFSAEQRTKEIGIRKALGATVSNIVGLLSSDFVRIVVVSFILAAPIAGILMSKWLDTFAYKIKLAWWIFAIAGLAALIIALITISFQAIRSARANPVDSLRTE